MTSKAKKKEWLQKNGFFFRSAGAATVKRTEGNITYEYPAGLDLPYTKWSSEQWNQKNKPSFSGFYAQLSETKQNLITIKNTSDEKQ